jgi:hypothetical protein
MKKIMFYFLLIIGLSSCFKQKDLEVTITEAEGIVTDGRSHNPIADFDICMFKTEKGLFYAKDQGTEIICTKTDSAGHYYLKSDLTEYKDYDYFVGDPKFNFKKLVDVGKKNTISIAYPRDENNVIVYGKILNKLSKIILDSISVKLLSELVPYASYGVQSEVYSKKGGTYIFNFNWGGGDTVRNQYFLFVPESNLFYKSDTIKVPYGKDSEINIELTPKP